MVLRPYIFFSTNMPWLFILIGWIMTLSLFTFEPTLSLAQNSEEDVEMLDVIEIPGTAIVREQHSLTFPTPSPISLSPNMVDIFVEQPSEFQRKHLTSTWPILLDEMAKIRGVRSAVKPIKTEHPPYPRFAREQGWKGTAILRLTINAKGTVESAVTKQSTGYSVLDESAIHTVKQWVFEPAKDGEFPIPSMVDLPIRFDLDQ